MSDVTRLGQGYCPRCGNETMWQDRKHLCSSCGVVEGPIEGNGPPDRPMRCMMFKHDKPYRQLRDHGFVKTVRGEKKDTRPVWISRGYPGKGYGKVAEGFRKKGTEIDPRSEAELFLHLKDSGFSTVEEWQEKIRENGPTDELPEKAYLHRVWLKKISITHYFWPDRRNGCGGPDSRGVMDLVLPVDGPVANSQANTFGEIEVYVAGDPRYEQ